jgi:hypothetical protein
MIDGIGLVFLRNFLYKEHLASQDADGIKKAAMSA